MATNQVSIQVGLQLIESIEAIKKIAQKSDGYKGIIEAVRKAFPFDYDRRICMYALTNFVLPLSSCTVNALSSKIYAMGRTKANFEIVTPVLENIKADTIGKPLKVKKEKQIKNKSLPVLTEAAKVKMNDVKTPVDLDSFFTAIPSGWALRDKKNKQAVVKYSVFPSKEHEGRFFAKFYNDNNQFIGKCYLDIMERYFEVYFTDAA